MAILRGGRRIGNFDIRLGLPRDKSLDNVESDPRIGRESGPSGERIVNTAEARIAQAAKGAKSARIQRGSNRIINDSKKTRPQGETAIGRFLAMVGQGEGFGFTNNFIVQINLPNSLIFDSNSGDTRIVSPSELTSSTMVRTVNAMCNKAEFPSRDIESTEYTTYGPQRKMPTSYTFPGEIEMSFYGDKYLRQRSFFENWQKAIFDVDSHNMNYYDNYVGSIDIYQLGNSVETIESGGDNVAGKAEVATQITYAVRLFEVYPETIGTASLEYSNTATVHNLPIKFAYRTWRNLTLDGMPGVGFGSTEKPEFEGIGDNMNIGTGGEGQFLPTSQIYSVNPLAGKKKSLIKKPSGFLSKLPPELRRAGRDVVNQVKRGLPIGRITGGRVFPPFL